MKINVVKLLYFVFIIAFLNVYFLFKVLSLLDLRGN